MANKPAVLFYYSDGGGGGVLIRVDFTHLQLDHFEGAGPRYAKDFSIVIQIRWKFRFTLISILIQWSLQNFVHDNFLYVENVLRSDEQQRNYSKAKFPSNLKCGKNR